MKFVVAAYFGVRIQQVLPLIRHVSASECLSVHTTHAIVSTSIFHFGELCVAFKAYLAYRYK